MLERQRAALGLVCAAARLVSPAAAWGEDVRLPEMIVEAPRATTAASSEEVRRHDLELRPRRRPADLLEVAPGLVVVQHAGGGKANQYFLRGFDVDHGTDLALFVDGVPVNMPSHAHGQGYADLHFLVPELVETARVSKGPYFLELGDFATAGAVDLVLRRRLGERSVAFTGGELGVRRGLVMADVPAGPLDAWVAGEGYVQDGPFEHPEGLGRYNLVARAGRQLAAGDLSLTAASYGADWNASGQIPARAVRAGILDRFGAVDPSEGGRSGRHQLYLRSALRPAPAWDLRGLAYVVRYDLDLWSNFTFFRDDPAAGDQIEQRDDRLLGGAALDATHHAGIAGIGLDTRLGFQLRADSIDNELGRTRRRVLLRRLTRNAVDQQAFAWYAGEDVVWSEWLRTIVGARVDHLRFDVGERLHARGPRASRGRASDTLASPKATAVLAPRRGWEVFLNFGRGFHSNDARGVTRRVEAADPTAAATGAEIGTRLRFLDRLDLAAAYFLLDLDSELVFVGDEGTTEASGRTRRHGLEVEARWRVTDWLSADVDVTRVEATFRDAPRGEDEIPLAPRHTVSGGLSARHPSGAFGSLRSRTVSDRPATEDGTLTARGYTVFDLEAGWAFRMPGRLAPGGPRFTLSVDVLNLLDADYREAQFATGSCLRRERDRVPGCIGAAPAGIADVNFTPGWPRTVLVTLKAAF
jgi:outer membrane receptor protein involved in Fe transport